MSASPMGRADTISLLTGPVSLRRVGSASDMAGQF